MSCLKLYQIIDNNKFSKWQGAKETLTFFKGVKITGRVFTDWATREAPINYTPI